MPAEWSEDADRARSLPRLIVTRLRRAVSDTVYGLARRIPLTQERKRALAETLFRRAPVLVSWSATYRNWKAESGRIAARRAQLKQLADRHAESPRHVELSGLPRPDDLAARAIAFYLPQFHPIPENDRWWGKGFTEWTNVRRARPQFEGHDQPRRPGELGYYDLLEQPWIRRRQAQLAHQYGLEGFCFYFYWFGGKRLLDAPIKAYAEDKEISFPFCLCWANEPWNRRWDGHEDDVLMAQSHSARDDIAFIRHLARYLRHPNYIRVGGRPLLLVYRPGLLPDAKATAERWRKWCRKNGIGEIYLAYTQSFDTVDPAEYGFDAAIKFPPNNLGLAPEPDLVAPVSDGFDAKIYDWGQLSAKLNGTSEPGYTLFEGVTPRWDNTPRRMETGTVFLGNSPERFARWVSEAAQQTAQRMSDPDERLLFVNAWNEWAEGAYLEPDQHTGYAYLEALRRGLQVPGVPIPVERSELVADTPPEAPAPRPKILVVVHDLHRHGAQYHSLAFVRTLKTQFGYDVATIACGEGQLKPQFKAFGTVVDVRQSNERDGTLEQIRQLRADGYAAAIINTSAAGWVADLFAEAGIDCIGLVHELPDIIARMKIEPGLEALDKYARTVVFASELVRDRTARDVLGRPWRNPVIQPQGLYKQEGVLELAEKDAARQRLRAELGLGAKARFVVGIGFGDHRKGIDRFLDWAVAAIERNAELHFVWVGSISLDMQEVCDARLQGAGEAAANIHLVGFHNDTSRFLAAADAYTLSSREDPFPSTVLEAMSHGVPVFMVSGTSGVEDLAVSGAVQVLETADDSAFADALCNLLGDRRIWRAAATKGLYLIRARFGFTSFVGDLLRWLGEPVPRISVVVPTYNYARYLPQRIASILNQSLPVWEIILLDDASSDDSVEVAQKLLQNSSVRYRIIRNRKNSGGVFKQWKKGVDLAEGDLVWIAEADDWAAHDFLEKVGRPFLDNPDIVLSYTQSHQVSGESEILCPHYLDYVADVDPQKWRRPFVRDGLEELAEGLSVKNAIPNVSGVLFRRDALSDVLRKHLREIASFRVAGDWCAYAHLAALGKIAFDPRPLNYHRRHASSVTISQFSRSDWEEIARMQEHIASRVRVPPELKARAKSYLDHLEREHLT